MAGPIEFGLRPRETRRSVWLLDPAVATSPCPLCAEIAKMPQPAAALKDHPRHGARMRSRQDQAEYLAWLEPDHLRLRDGAEPCYVEYRPLTRLDVGYIRDKTGWGLGTDHSPTQVMTLAFRLGVRFPTIPAEVEASIDGSTVTIPTMTVQDGHPMLSERLVDLLFDASWFGDDAILAYGARVLRGSTMAESDRFLSSLAPIEERKPSPTPAPDAPAPSASSSDAARISA
jgi:hypothetical protein